LLRTAVRFLEVPAPGCWAAESTYLHTYLEGCDRFFF